MDSLAPIQDNSFSGTLQRASQSPNGLWISAPIKDQAQLAEEKRAKAARRQRWTLLVGIACLLVLYVLVGSLAVILVFDGSSVSRQVTTEDLINEFQDNVDQCSETFSDSSLLLLQDADPEYWDEDSTREKMAADGKRLSTCVGIEAELFSVTMGRRYTHTTLQTVPRLEAFSAALKLTLTSGGNPYCDTDYCRLWSSVYSVIGALMNITLALVSGNMLANVAFKFWNRQQYSITLTLVAILPLYLIYFFTLALLVSLAFWVESDRNFVYALTQALENLSLAHENPALLREPVSQMVAEIGTVVNLYVTVSVILGVFQLLTYTPKCVSDTSHQFKLNGIPFDSTSTALSGKPARAANTYPSLMRPHPSHTPTLGEDEASLSTEENFAVLGAEENFSHRSRDLPPASRDLPPGEYVQITDNKLQHIYSKPSKPPVPVRTARLTELDT